MAAARYVALVRSYINNTLVQGGETFVIDKVRTEPPKRVTNSAAGAHQDLAQETTALTGTVTLR